MRNYLRSLNPQLPRSVQILQLGGLLNAIGNGLILPFTLIYLHNERGIGLGTAGLILGTNAAVSLVAGPVAGALIDRVGAKRMLAIALLFLTVGIAGYALVETAWQGFLAATSSGSETAPSGRPSRSMLAGLAPREKRPAVFAMQRVTMNLGIGIGGLAGGFIASESFQALFVIDAFTFVGYAAVLWLFVPEPRQAVDGQRARGATGRLPSPRLHGTDGCERGSHRAGIAQLEILPAYAKNEVGIAETGSASSSSSTRSRSCSYSFRSQDSPGSPAHDVHGAGRRGLRCVVAARAGERTVALGRRAFAILASRSPSSASPSACTARSSPHSSLTSRTTG